MNFLIRLPVILAIVVLQSITVCGALPNENVIYNSSIKTVLLYKKGFEMAMPVMRLGDPDGLVLSFDDLDGDIKNYKFTVVHCESDWKTSEEIRQNDYIEGDSEDLIDNYAYSFNTLVSYTHYSLDFPSRSLKVKISGNYLLIVYVDNPESPSFTWRFMVAERTALGVTAEVHQATNIDDRLTMQEVDFTVSYNGFQVYEPVRQLEVIVTQNDRWDNAVSNIKPRFVRNESLDYNYDGLINFNAGNEFRAFDIKSLKYNSERIKKIDIEGDVTRVYLMDDERRTFKKYATEQDINGRKLIKNEERAEDSSIEADYVNVVFSLPFDAWRANGSMYIMGAVTDWQIKDNSKMEFNFENKSYTKELLLKQGYYNYLYVFRDNTIGKADEALVEGNHWETENEYTVWIYYREMGGLTDRLIAVQNINTIR